VWGWKRGERSLGHANGDITTHYSAAEVAELIAAVRKIEGGESAPG